MKNYLEVYLSTAVRFRDMDRDLGVDPEVLGVVNLIWTSNNDSRKFWKSDLSTSNADRMMLS